MKELLYEKIASIIEAKDKVHKENEVLKSQLNEFKEKIEFLENKQETNFIENLSKIVESISVDENGEFVVNENLFVKTPETLMAKYFVKIIQDKAKEKGLDAKKIVEEILIRIR